MKAQVPQPGLDRVMAYLDVACPVVRRGICTRNFG